MPVSGEAIATSIAVQSQDASQEVHFCLDYGTTKSAVAFQIVDHHSQSMDPSKTRVIRLQDGDKFQAQTLGFVEDREGWQFYWGSKMHALQREPGFSRKRSFIFTSLKLGIWPSIHESRKREEVEHALAELRQASGGKIDLYTIDDLLALHLYEIRRAAELALITTLEDQEDPRHIATMLHHWIHTVPEATRHRPNDRYMCAIRKAGFPAGVRLVSEGECAAVWGLHKSAHRSVGNPAKWKVRTLVCSQAVLLLTTHHLSDRRAK